MRNGIVALAPIAGVFAVAELIATFIPSLLSRLGVPVNLSCTVVCSVAAAAVAAFVFVKRFGRAPDSREHHHLAWLSLAITWGLWLVTMGLWMSLTEKASIDTIQALLTAMPFAVILLIFVVSSAVYLGGYYLMYGWGARVLAEKLAIKH